ncbi:pimeloyl-ACP methyl ester carboxylesterase [Halanaerobium saccharolyticum]|uniref:Pimeloyl-ACP methyl ester carboxylesterase n=1 Tax=Halanaerobium saccharolyticum TaxID=43595 RepID=A0A4R6M2W7_9FIRM|nr:alpha/beta hydrolase [Halanaerobium saccharolyticum]TDO94770.1 pimeloyl-ACP methyl ester carboxylesterase [Halanaerobium saccharolyticum]
MKSEIVKLKKGTMEYTFRGRGPVVLNLHGGHSNCQETFGIQPLLEAGYSILTPSRPGYGKTDIEAKTPAESAFILIELLDHLDIDKVNLIAVSAGGPTAIYLAANYSARVKKLVLESAASRSWVTKKDLDYNVGKIIFNPKSQKIIWLILRKIANNFPSFFAKIFLPQFSTLTRSEVMARMNSNDLEAVVKMVNRYSSDKGFMYDLEHQTEKEVLQKIEVPTLILHSKFDKSVSFKHAEYASENIKNSEIYADDFWGHLIWIGKSKKNRDNKLLEFLASNHC